MRLKTYTVVIHKNWRFLMAKKKKEEKAVPEGEEAPKKKGGLVPKIAMLVALGGASFGAVYLLPRPESAPAPTEYAAAETQEVDEPYELDLETSYLELSPMTISLQDDMRILKIGITLETLAGTESEIDPSDPKIRDAFMGYLRALRLDQVQDAAFMAQMRAQLLRRVQIVVGPGKVHGILITDFMVR